MNPIKLLRKLLDANQQELAQLLGIGQGTVSRIENGGAMSRATALAIWDQYGTRLRGAGMSLTDLLGWGAGESEPTDPPQEVAS